MARRGRPTEYRNEFVDDMQKYFDVYDRQVLLDAVERKVVCYKGNKK